MKNTILAIGILIALTSCNQNLPVKNLETSVNKIDSTTIKQLFTSSLTNGQSYQWLNVLSNEIGGRLSGSPEAQQAVEWGEKLMKEQGFDKVWLQPVMVPHWVRGEKEEAYFMVNNTKFNVPICALGGSTATPNEGITGEVVEVKSLEEAEALGEKLRGKIVFFNRPFDDAFIETFYAYGGCDYYSHRKFAPSLMLASLPNPRLLTQSGVFYCSFFTAL